MFMDVSKTEERNLELEFKNSGLDPNVDEGIKFEIEDIIKSEQFESDHGGGDHNCQPLLDKIEEDVKSEELQFVGSTENFDLSIVPAVLDRLKKENNSEDLSMDFEREIQAFHVKNGIDEVKLESNEVFIKDETDHNLVSAESEKLDCTICGKTFKTKKTLSAHRFVHKDPSTVTLWKCSECNYESKYKYNFEHHLRTHTIPEIQMYQCALCNFSAKRKLSLRRHIQQLHQSISVPIDPEKLKCTICSKTFKSKQTLSAHKLVHKEPTEKLECSICSKTFKSKKTLSGHKFVHKERPTPTESEKLECTICNKRFKTKKTLSAHKLVHTDPSIITLWKCSECNYESKYRHNFELHLLTHKDPSEIKMFHCTLCNYSAKRKLSLRRHTEAHHINLSISVPIDPETLKCTICRKTFKTKQILSAHKYVHKEPTEKFECSICSKTFKTKRTLAGHKLVHTDPSTVTLWKCSECKYESKYRNNFELHLLTHKDQSEIEMFQCALCSYSAKRKLTLRRHIETRHIKARSIRAPAKPVTIKFWKCSECCFETKYRHRLRDHMLVHKDPSEIEMFHCYLCGFKSKRKRDLRRHILRHMDQYK